MKIINTICLVITFLLILPAPLMAADSGFQAGLDAEGRSADEKDRDATRKPAQVIAFLGLESGMTVLDIMASSGYYTEVLSAAVGPTGTVVSQNAPRMLQMGGAERVDAIKNKVMRLGNVELLITDLATLGMPGRGMGAGGMAAGMGGGMAPAPDIGPHSESLDDYTAKIDLAVTALNFHDMVIFGGDSGAREFLENVHKMLKPGGTLGLIDHVGIAGQDNNALHRIEVATVLDYLKGAGFEIEAESDILTNPADDHTLNMRDPSLGRNTDRMLIRAIKPAG